MPDVSGPKLRPWQFSLRTLLLLPVIVALLAIIGSRIHHNRQQREAVHSLWHMGAKTSDKTGVPFISPTSGIDWTWHNRENWFDDLMGTHEPIAIMLDIGDSDNHAFSESDFEEVVTLIRQIPSIKSISIAGNGIDHDNLKRLQKHLPNVTVEQSPSTVK